MSKNDISIIDLEHYIFNYMIVNCEYTNNLTKYILNKFIKNFNSKVIYIDNCKNDNNPNIIKFVNSIENFTGIHIQILIKYNKNYTIRLKDCFQIISTMMKISHCNMSNFGAMHDYKIIKYNNTKIFYTSFNTKNN